MSENQNQNQEAAKKAAAEKKAAEKEAAKKAAAKHVAVTKNGKTIHVHPQQVEQHERLGWFQVNEE